MKQIHFAKNILKLDGANASRIAKRVGRSPSTVRKWMREGIPKSAEADCVKALRRAVSKQQTAIADRQSARIAKGSGRTLTAERLSTKKSARIAQAPVRGKGRKSVISSQSSVVSQKKKKAVGGRQSAVGSQQAVHPKSPRSGRKVVKNTISKPLQGHKQDVSKQQSAIGTRQSARTSKSSGRKPKDDDRRPLEVPDEGLPKRSGRLPKPDARRPAPTWEPGTFVPLTEREKNEQRHQKQLAEEEFERLSLLLNHVKALKLANDVRKSGVNGMRRVYRLHGKNKNQRQTLYDMIDNEDEAWVKFYEMCEEMGMSEPEIRSSWFSPK